MKTLFVEWFDSAKNTWLTVGKLTESNSKYTFRYSKAASQSEAFTPFGLMNNLNITYESDELFPFFLNRILNKSRPEFKKFLSWLNLDPSASPMEVLSLSQGTRETDSLRVYSLPQKKETVQSMTFFVAGMSHVDLCDTGRIRTLHSGEQLFLMDDIQNEYQDALTIRTSEPKLLVGYCPSFVSNIFKSNLLNNKDSIFVKVVKVNLDAPSPYKLLCEASLPLSFEVDLANKNFY